MKLHHIYKRIGNYTAGIILISLLGYAAETDIIINEIHYYPKSDLQEEEYVELYNRGSQPVDLSGWSFSQGIRFVFPQGTILAERAYLIVARNTNRVRGMTPDHVSVLGNFEGRLADNGETLTLLTATGQTADSVRYNDAPPWPTSPDGQGASLERISPFGPSSDPMNWAGGRGAVNGPWTQITLSGSPISRYFYFHLHGTGSIWLDDIQISPADDSENLVKNGSFETTIGDEWRFRGNHTGSLRIQTSQAHSGDYVLQVVSPGEMDNMASNSVFQAVENIQANQPYTLSFWMRIIDARGSLMVDGGGGKIAATIPFNNALFSPGQINSVYSENIPPFVQNVAWNPRCPKPNASVEVQARITDSDGVNRAELHFLPIHLTSPNPTERILVMQRTAGSPEEGTWTVTIPGQSDRTLIRFWLEVTDKSGVHRTHPAPTESRKTLTYFHYADDARSTIPIVFLYDFGGEDDPEAFRNDSAFVIRYPDRDGWEVYDYINTTRRTRSGDGWDVRFVKHYELDDMSSINIAFEAKSRYLLAEWLSYKIYHSLGVIAGNVDHYRFIRNNRDYGYYLMFEQPNKHFIARNGLNNQGNLYKLHWSYDRSTSSGQISALHEKRTNLTLDKSDIVETIQTLHQYTGRQQTVYIESQFAIDQFIDYYVGCQLISDWDGYFNNHFVYHDTEGSGLWYIFPWDKDKTWGDSDAYREILPYYDFYDFPILFGAYGISPSGKGNRTWWRPAGYFSGPLLANTDIQKQYLHRLGYVGKNIFTPERWIPVIDALEIKLESEVRHRAQIMNENVNNSLDLFHTEIESFRRQVINRQTYILTEVEKLIGPVSVKEWNLY